jgi:serine/threonine-protein kinase
VALVSFVDEDRQWFKARVNFDRSETSRDISFCAHALEERRPLIVPDTDTDPRFADNPVVALADPRVRFYAGIPLRLSTGSALGTLCVIDYEPRTLTTAQVAALESLARHIERELQLRRALGRARSSAPPNTSFLDAGEVVGGRWTLVRALGHGGMGQVFEARGAAGERAAIKFMRREWAAQPAVVERFVREARVMLQVGHPNVARILEVGNLGEDHAGLPFIVLEYLEGTDLERVVASRGKVEWRQATTWVRDACRGLAAAHQHGIVHRDIKPSNIFVARVGSSEIVKVIDFGIAKLRDDGDPDATGVTRAGSLIGTPLYMAPEQMVAAERVDAAADIWAVGAVLHQLVCGRPPFPGNTDMEVCAAVLARAPASMRVAAPDAPPELEAVVQRCLQKAPEARFASAADLVNALRDVIEHA